jgi:hypothetical protein
MSDVPSIKGSIFGRGVEDLLKLVADEQISRAELERRLEPGDLVHLDEPISPFGWYDVQTYGRILDLLREIAGAGSNLYLQERGARSAEALINAGVYQQMEYLTRTKLASAIGDKERFEAFGRDLKLLVSMHGNILNFGKQISRVDPEYGDRYLLEISEAEAYPEPLCWTTEGLINRMAKQHDMPNLWEWNRPQPDLVVFRMLRPA